MVTAWEGEVEVAESSRQDKDPLPKRRVVNGSGLGQFLPPGAKHVVLVGQAKAGKTSLANLLTFGKTSTGPFPVGQQTESAVQHVTTVYSDALEAYVTDTPGLFDSDPEQDIQKQQEESEDIIRTVTHFLHQDGGLIVWVMDDTNMSPKKRAFVKVMSRCMPGWDKHTMIVIKHVDAAVFSALEREIEASKPTLSYEQFVDQACSIYNVGQLADFNKAASKFGMSFHSLATFRIRDSDFTSDRFCSAVASFVRRTPSISPGLFSTWESCFDRLKEESLSKQANLQSTYTALIASARMRMEEHERAARLLRNAGRHVLCRWRDVPILCLLSLWAGETEREAEAYLDEAEVQERNAAKSRGELELLMKDWEEKSQEVDVRRQHECLNLHALFHGATEHCSEDGSIR